MNDLNENWTPSFGTVYIWFAMDKYGKIAIMINNCWGWLPQKILAITHCERKLGLLQDFIEFNPNRPSFNADVVLKKHSQMQQVEL